MDEKYIKIIPKAYAEKVKQEYAGHPEKWYATISPKSAADRFIKETNDDFSKIWHEHCMECWTSIDANMKECYVSEDGFEWLCADCFRKRSGKMNVQKFFYLTIQGNELDLDEVQNLIHLPCKIFRKGEITAKNINGHPVLYDPQKTNRWLYTVEDISEVSAEDFLLKQLLLLDAHKTELQKYISNGMADLELTLYTDNATNFELNTAHISILNQLGLGISISFC